MRESAKRRKNFLPSLFLAFVFWAIWAFIILKVPPGSFFSFLVFYLFLFLAVFLSLALIFANSRRGLLISIAFIVFLFLKQVKLASILNLLFLIGVLFSLEIHFSRR